MELQLVGPLKFRIDFSQPLYEQILNQVRSAIAKGEIGLGDKMPSVRELAQVLRVNPNTVMRAYQELERDGLTEKRQGQGTYVTSSRDRVQDFRSDLAERYVGEFLIQMASLGLSLNDVVHIIQKHEPEGEH
ncbi:GntR family transcriptional regulator [Gorillibacterium sp. sgz5001074]|uniref:GntR family transcriptional regulator n=1 Tax=Gorillibacterium sp. sgz5001074 TaxID=3446695 RepID=UPI003F665BD8